MLRISDIMTREVFTLRPTATADEASWALAVRGISGAPVRDGMERLVGVISRSDLSDPERHPLGLGEQQVKDIMTPAMLTMQESEPALNAVRLMVREAVHRVLVVNEAGDLVGIVTPTDVLRALLEGDSLDAGHEADDRDEERPANDQHGGPVVIH